MSQAGAYHTWPKPRSTPTFPGNLATGWTLVGTQGGQRPYGTSPCCLCSWGCSGCSPSVPSSAPGPHRGWLLVGGTSSRQTPRKTHRAALSSPKPLPTQPPGVPTEGPGAGQGGAQRGPCCTGYVHRCRCAPGCVRVNACVCPPYVSVCACACGGRARPQLGAPDRKSVV